LKNTVKAAQILSICLALFVLTSCGSTGSEPPEPGALYEEIKSAVELPPMSDVAEYMLEANTGIAAAEYDSAVYYVPEEGMAPDQIIIVRAKDAAGAEAIEDKLNEWLTYQEEGSRVYMTENMPLFQTGVIRRDGLTVSLIVSARVAEIEAVYRKYH